MTVVVVVVVVVAVTVFRSGGEAESLSYRRRCCVRDVLFATCFSCSDRIPSPYVNILIASVFVSYIVFCIVSILSRFINPPPQ